MSRLHFVLPLALLSVAAVSPASAAQVWVATHALYHGDIVQRRDVVKKTIMTAPFEAVPVSQNIIGMEVKQSIYSGWAVTQREIGPPSLVKVSTPVEVIWKAPGIELQLNGRALDSGAMGDEVRVLNPSTSRTISGKVIGPGLVEVQGGVP